MTEQTKTNRSIPNLLFSLFRLAYDLRPSLLVVNLLNALFQALNILVSIYSPKLIIDQVQGKLNIDLINLISLILVAKFVTNYIADVVQQRLNHEFLQFKKHTMNHFSNKVNRIKYSYLEDPRTLELKEKAWSPLQFGIFDNLVIQMQQVLKALFTIIGIVAILLQFSFLLFVIVTLLAIVGMVIESYASIALKEFQKSLIPINRKYGYYFQNLFDEKRQKEFRLYNLNELIFDKIKTYNEDIAKKIHQVQVLSANSKIASTFTNVLSRFIIYAYSGLRVLGIWGTQISIGNFSVLISANENYGNALREFGIGIMQAKINLPLVEATFDFLDLPEFETNESKISPEKLDKLTFENVTFSYPNTERKILDNVSFEINHGESLAIVGRNNAGKSTIVKLICRLFEPNEGRILWNGIDINEFSYKEYMKQLSTVFQDFMLFPISIWENITCTVPDGHSEITKADRNKIEAILREVKMDEVIKKLPKGLDTKLDKTLHDDATDLSGGQKQKLAIARAVYQDSSIAILDEPTAALDPLAEAEVYGHFAQLVRGKTAIFISHRMSASRFCDRIIVLDGGHITGDGNHDKMIKENDLYKSLYQAQAQYYA